MWVPCPPGPAPEGWGLAIAGLGFGSPRTSDPYALHVHCAWDGAGTACTPVVGWRQTQRGRRPDVPLTEGQEHRAVERETPHGEELGDQHGFLKPETPQD